MSDRQRVITWQDPFTGAKALPGLGGLAYLRAMKDGELPPPPINSTMRMQLVGLEAGEVTFEAEPDESLYNPIGSVHGGFACTLLDSAIGCAGLSTLPAGHGFTSIDLHVSYLRGIRGDSGVLRCVGRVVKPGRRVIFGEGVLTDGQGNKLATATSSLLVVNL